MTQYEEVWKSQNGNYYLRERDIETLETAIRKIDPVFESYEQISSESDLKFILDDQVNLRRVTFDSDKEKREYLKTCEMINKRVYGTQPAHYAYIRENYFDNGLDLKQRVWFLDIEAVADRGFPDPDKAEWEINVMQIYDNYTNKNIILTSKPLNDPEAFKKNNPNVTLKQHENEIEMAKTFLSLLEFMKPTMMSTWNGEGFDIPYITNRFKKLNGVNYRRLSPINVIKEDNYMGETKITWEGITHIDMMLAYKEFTYVTQTSYNLDNIAKVELDSGDGKVDYGEFNTIKDFFKGNWDKFVEYAARDTEILKELEDKLKLNELVKILAYKMGINMSDTFGTVKPWGMYLTNLAMQKNLVMPKDEKHTLDKGVIGGYVAPPQKGLHDWVASIDYNSMYPKNIESCNMSAETYVPYDLLPADAKAIYDKYMSDEDEDKFLDDTVMKEVTDLCQKYNYSFGLNAFFKKDFTGILAQVMGDVYAERKVAKGKMLIFKTLGNRIADMKIDATPSVKTDAMQKIVDEVENLSVNFDNVYEIPLDFTNEEFSQLQIILSNKEAYWDTMQMALKISINSAYGALSNAYFVLFNRDIAASITGNGRLIIKKTGRYVNEQLNLMLKTDKDWWVYSDTDSVVGDTLIHTKFGEIPISEYYDKIQGDVEVRGENNFIKHITEDDETFSVSEENKLRKNKIKYVMKHRVKKRMFRITIDGKSVTVTQDHSVIVLRDGERQEVKPQDLKNTDFLIKLVK